MTGGKSTRFIRDVLFELQIEYKCARVVRVCVHVPSSSPSAAVTEKKKARPAIAGIIEKWTRHSSKLFPVCFCSPSPHYTSVSPFDYYNDQRAIVKYATKYATSRQFGKMNLLEQKRK